MLLEIHSPAGRLGQLIDSITYFEGYTAEHKADKLLPDGGIFIILNMLEKPERLFKNEQLTRWQEFSGAFISGQHQRFILIEADHASNLSIKFRPGGAAPFFNFPVSQLNNKVQQLEPILGAGIEQVRQAIINENAVPAKFRLIENYLESLISADYSHNQILAAILQQMEEKPEQVEVKQLAGQMNVSQKHLISIFNKQVGLTPKILLRIFRFQRVIKLLEQKQEVDWMQVVADCGYYDQSHFVKDFYNFSGIRPTLYQDQKGDYLNYIPQK